MNNTYYQRPNNSEAGRYHQPSYQASQKEILRSSVVTPRRTGKDLITNIILVVLSISLVLAIFKLGDELSYMNRHHERSANLFWMEYDSGRYVDSIKNKYENIYNDVLTTAELSQCYAVSEYFEAASLYKAAVVTGKTDKVQEYLTVMEESLDKMGDVDYLAEEINVKLGIGELEE